MGLLENIICRFSSLERDEKCVKEIEGGGIVRFWKKVTNSSAVRKEGEGECGGLKSGDKDQMQMLPASPRRRMF